MTTQNAARDRRGIRALAIQARITEITATAPDASPRLVTTIANLDRHWGPDQSWKQALAELTVDEQLAVASPSAVEGPVTEPTKPEAKRAAPRPSKAESVTVTKKAGRWWPRRTAKTAAISAQSASTLTKAEATTGTAATETKPQIDAKPAPESTTTGEPFAVPAPGKPIKDGTVRSWIARLAIVVGPLVLVGGLAYSCGVNTGSERLAVPMELSDEEATTWHLDTFPRAEAAAFGQTYLTICLTAPSDDTEAKTRNATLARMSSTQVSAGCGISNPQSTDEPIAITWDGNSSGVGTFTEGAAARLTFTITAKDGRLSQLSLPIWASADGSTLRVVGDLARMPVLANSPAPQPAPAAVKDGQLARSLTDTVIAPFLTAWASSDDIALGLVLSNNATAKAKVGLDRQLRDPKIALIEVVVLRGVPEDGYRDGDQVAANVTVDWATSGNTSTQRMGYTITLTRGAGRWLVRDITGAPLDQVGGRAPNTEYPEQTKSKAPAATSATTPTAPITSTGPSPSSG